MADPEHLEILSLGIDVWNRWRAKRLVKPDLRRADLRNRDLMGADFREADLSEAQLEGSRLVNALFDPGWRIEQRKPSTDWTEREVIHFTASVGLTLGDAGANLRNANLRHADLKGADFVGANLWGADLAGADLANARFSSSTVWPEGYEPVEYGALPVLESFTLKFDQSLSPEQVRATLQALADYYRACGGVGFRVDAEIDDVLITVPVYA